MFLTCGLFHPLSVGEVWARPSAGAWGPGKAGGREGGLQQMVWTGVLLLRLDVWQLNASWDLDV